MEETDRFTILLRERSGPRVYDVCCPQCGWRKTIELGKVGADSRCIHGQEPVILIFLFCSFMCFCDIFFQLTLREFAIYIMPCSIDFLI